MSKANAGQRWIRSTRQGIGRFASYVVLSLISCIFLAPIAWMLKTALTGDGSLFLLPVRPIPNPIDFSSFVTIWRDYPFADFYANSLKIAFLAMAGQLFSCSFTAFALTNLRFPGRGLLLIIILGTMMVPLQVTMVPQFLLFNRLHWLDTHYPLWVPAFFGGVSGAFGIFLLRQGLMTIPHEFYEAATMDGANPWHMYLRIAMPLLRPQLTVLAVFAFMSSWNDFLAPIIFITTPERMTVTGGLSFFQAQWHVYWNQLMAGALLAILPVMVLYALGQRYFVQASFASGLKG